MKVYDVIVVGGGPAGLQAAISAATDGLTVAIVEKSAGVGGQIGNTPRLENVAFVNGAITGPDFAHTMRMQAERLGVRILTGYAVKHLSTKPNGILSFAFARSIQPMVARFAILALGKRWTDNEIAGMKHAYKAGTAFVGPVMCLRNEYAGKDVGVIGGGPAAAQAILELAGKAKTVHMFVRGGVQAPLYLLDRIPNHGNIHVHVGFEVDKVVPHTTDKLRVVSTQNDFQVIDCIFACNGLQADTDWLPKTVRMNDGGQVVTALPSLETTMPGVFAIGDCRAGSHPRVGSAMGDGSNVVSQIWGKLAMMDKPMCTNCDRIFG